MSNYDVFPWFDGHVTLGLGWCWVTAYDDFSLPSWSQVLLAFLLFNHLTTIHRLETTCIEKPGTLGGTGSNIGCIPSKSTLSNSHLQRHQEAWHR